MTTQRPYKQSAGVQALPQGDMIQGWQAPPPGYLAATSRGITRYIPRDDPPARSIVGEVLPPEQAPIYMPPQAQPLSRIELRTTYADRSRGYLISMLPLAAVASLVGVIIAVSLFSVPLLSGAALLTFWAIFASVYLVSYLAHLLVSPDGAAFLAIFGVYRMAAREQRHRHEAFWARYEDEREDRA